MIGFFTRKFKTLIATVVNETVQHPSVVSGHNVDLFVQAMLKEYEHQKEINDPEFFVRQLHDGFIPYAAKVERIKWSETSQDEAGRRFQRLIECLKRSVPALPVPVSLDIVQVLDAYLGKTNYLSDWGGDIGWVLRIGSTGTKSGRVLYSTVRFMRPRLCVEAGTFLGISALFILWALSRYCEYGHLATVEPSEIYHDQASSILVPRFQDHVRCWFGTTQDCLGDITKDESAIDFFFHDNGHSYEDYTRDFERMLDKLASHSVVMFDDIRWGSSSGAGCYKAWTEIVSHSRVRCAAEIDSDVGIMLMT